MAAVAAYAHLATAAAMCSAASQRNVIATPRLVRSHRSQRGVEVVAFARKVAAILGEGVEDVVVLWLVAVRMRVTQGRGRRQLHVCMSERQHG